MWKGDQKMTALTYQGNVVFRLSEPLVSRYSDMVMEAKRQHIPFIVDYTKDITTDFVTQEQFDSRIFIKMPSLAHHKFLTLVPEKQITLVENTFWNRRYIKIKVGRIKQKFHVREDLFSQLKYLARSLL